MVFVKTARFGYRHYYKSFSPTRPYEKEVVLRLLLKRALELFVCVCLLYTADNDNDSSPIMITGVTLFFFFIKELYIFYKNIEAEICDWEYFKNKL